jgi:hypothetical protein
MSVALMLRAVPQESTAALPGKPAQLTAPDQVLVRLVQLDWTRIRAAYEAGRDAFQCTAGMLYLMCKRPQRSLARGAVALTAPLQRHLASSPRPLKAGPFVSR